MTTPQTLSSLLTPHSQRFEIDRAALLVEPDTPDTLAEAMHYCTEGGKRLRPALVYVSAAAVGGADADITARAAVAVECIHCYSLVHDDLPAMDNDTLRRGRPTAHVKFGEAMAILVGDALLTRAFSLLGVPGGGLLAAELGAAAGAAGLIAGQVADMDLCTAPAGASGVRYIHRRKTAALIAAAARMGARCGGADASQLDAIGQYGLNLGLAFQVLDDLLDVSASAENLGKTPGKDSQVGKRTAVAALGTDGAQTMANELTESAVSALDILGPAREELVALAGLLSRRDR